MGKSDIFLLRRYQLPEARAAPSAAGGLEFGRGAEAVLRLMCPARQDDFDVYGEFHETHEYEHNHASHYADHRVPQTIAPAAFLSRPNRRSTLKIARMKRES